MLKAHHERSVVSESQKSQPQAVEDVDHAGHSSILAKSNNSMAVFIHHFLVVDAANVLCLKRQ